MKLELAKIFGEHMILQREEEIKVWGRSCEGDEILVELGDQKTRALCKGGEWLALLAPEKACEKTSLKVSSAKTGEKICFEDVAIGDVFLAGGQSNMEFIMKYDFDLPETKMLPSDRLLRQFTYPQSAYQGHMETNPHPEEGYWRIWDKEEDRICFSAIAAYMSMDLRETIHVPIGIISCNWGGTPAAAWSERSELEADEAIRPILDWHERCVKATDWERYIAASDKRQPEPDEAQKAFNDRFMMGEDLTEFFKNFDPSKLPKLDYMPFEGGPRSNVRPCGLYENMLKKIAPYGVKGFLWYQGEDDDAREWYSFYDHTMCALIRSWRKLWEKELPFYQIELAPFEGVGATGAKHYDLMRKLQHKVMKQMKDVYNVCILDAGERFNIHPRHKKVVGKRLARTVLKHSYGMKVNADCPEAVEVHVDQGKICIRFENAFEGMKIKGELKDALKLKKEEKLLDYTADIDKDTLILTGDLVKGSLEISYCEANYCPAVLFNSMDDPAYAFHFEVEL
ncbi:MAG: hypothetical protein IKQ98_01130 [Erysipelotrichaceae bacterium]|nr:hypothetical protein [Erysipelotrichaceae bacterium]